MHDPACLDAFRKALTYVGKKTESFTGAWAPLFQDAIWKQAEAAIDAAILAGDVAATKAACRQWWDIAIEFAKAAEKAERKAKLLGVL